MQSTTSSEHQLKDLDYSWNHIEEQYEILDILGQGSFGQVVQARHR